MAAALQQSPPVANAPGGPPALSDAGGDQSMQFVSFTIGDEEYGVDIMSVREIRGWTDATRLPNAPAWVRGVINLRGAMIPIYDLRARFGSGETEATKTHVVIIVAVAQRTVGMLVDAVSDIVTIVGSAIQPVPEIDRAVDIAYLNGLVTVDGRMIALLSLERLFDLAKADAALAALAGA
jgi:purine-binding chemotaxis protein CheW